MGSLANIKNAAGSQGSAEGEQILNEYPGMRKSYPKGVQIIDASDARKAQAPQWTNVRQSEFYHPGEKGGQDMLPNPGDKKKAVLEIYNKDYQKAGPARKELVVGELLHGLKNDPKYKQLRTDFANNFSPAEKLSQVKNMQNPNSDFYSETPGETHGAMMERSGIDAYIRGSFMPSTGGEWTSAYTPKQAQIVDQIHQYLKTPDQPKSRSNFLKGGD